jgi:Ca-activated chloride channel family protein
MLVPRTEQGAEDQPPLETKSLHATVTIDNQVATTRIEQVFVNHTEFDLEAVYLIPLPEAATVSDFAYWAGGKRIAAEIREKQEARDTYERITGLRRDPALLEKVGRNLFQARIYPVSPTEPMKVELEYQQVVPYDSGRVSYTYPLTVGGQQERIRDLTIVVKIKDQKPITNVESATHRLSVTQPDPHTVSASFEASRVKPDKDFSLTYTVTSADFGINFLTYRKPNERGYFLLMVAPQEETSEGDIVRKDVVFVFDKSGSMQGEKLEQAKRALRFYVTHLEPNDRFNLVIFSDSLSVFREELAGATSRDEQEAVEFINDLEATGGTDLNSALLKALGMMESSDRQRTVILVTDGLPTVGVTDTPTILGNLAKANQTKTRVFTFGVGDDVDDQLLLTIATAHRGAEEHVRNNEKIDAKVSAFAAKVSKPVLVDLKIDFGGARTEEVYPATLPDVFKGSQLIITGRYRGESSDPITLSGEINGRPKTFSYPGKFVAQTDENPFIARLWAKDRVDHLLDQIKLHGENNELKDEIIRLSKEFRFATPYTSFLAVPKEVQAAMNQGRFATGGDPWVRVTAPPDTVRVTALFPWGETKPLTLDPRDGRWTVRFIVPKGTVHGDYEVVIVLTHADGTQQRFTVRYQADLEAPQGLGRALATAVPGGWRITLSVEASEDAERVDVLVPGGDLTGLARQDGSPEFRGEVTVPASEVRGPSVFLPVLITDAAHNRLEIEVEVELPPSRP